MCPVVSFTYFVPMQVKVHKTEAVKKATSGTWKPFKKTLQEMCGKLVQDDVCTLGARPRRSNINSV
jgi:hypothetical protein